MKRTIENLFIGTLLAIVIGLVINAIFINKAFAQGQPSPQEQLQSCTDQAAVISRQREQALNEQAAVVANANAAIRKVQAEVERLTKLCGDVCKPKDETKK